ncbi:MAG: hypothetical protein QM492_02725 [Rhodobacterales bacterium]
MTRKTQLSRQDRIDAIAVLVLRLGLAWFIFLWAAHKLITPKQYQNLAQYYDHVHVSLTQIYTAGSLQVILCILVVLGIFRYFSYGSLAIMHFFTLTRRWEGFFHPFVLNKYGFPINRNQVIDLAVFAAFIALILLIHRDHYSIGGWLARKGKGRWWI